MAKKLPDDVVDTVGADSFARATEVAPTVAMHRDYEELLGEPTTANVHPDEVEHWQAVGWLIVAEASVNDPD